MQDNLVDIDCCATRLRVTVENPELDSEITITKRDKSVGATKLMALMGLAVKCGETITVTIEGGDENASEAAMRKLLEENL